MSAEAVALTVSEAKTFLAKQVDGWLKFMAEHGLTHASFRIDSDGLHDDATAIDVGLHCELLEARGCEIISHSAVLVRVPDLAGKPQDKTVTSLLVRAPKREN